MELQSQVEDLKLEMYEEKKACIGMQSQVNTLLAMRGSNPESQMRCSTNYASNQSDVDDVVDCLTVGPKLVGIKLGHQGQCRRATTEVGTAMTSYLLKCYEDAKVESCERISIIPHGQSLSQTVFHRLDDVSCIFERRLQLLHRLQVLFGGRAAEEVIYGRDTSGASVSYLADASWLARKILTMWCFFFGTFPKNVVLLDKKVISGEQIEYILDQYPAETPVRHLLEENPGSLPFFEM
ncbi:hypothetical protein IFM89_032918 [Coptis chinensis]|uniref:Peptidase M41 domain-containing protein n=1 Tax=Coptis chinensis TaxID=261450 RepID=A0A835IWB6_9MAGN|nr:hypothetical protein IFM89_032918 [Coptis chinensis]